ncbi:MAG: DUF1565 domain-containing protein [Nannocystales bacterium]
MSARVLLVLGLLNGCAATSDSDSFGGNDFGEGTSGGPTGGMVTTTPPASGEDSSGSPGTSDTDGTGTGGLETGSGNGESSGEVPGFEKGPGLYVNATVGADSNDGSREAPMRSIQWALQEAQAQGLPAVYVSQGLYTATHDDLASIELRPGVSLYGGFSATSWDDRDPALYPTEVIDESVATTGVSDLLPHHAVHAPVGVFEDVVVDGFTITAAEAGYAAAVFIEGGSPTLTGNTILGRPAASVTTAVRINGGRPVFTDNIIDPVGAVSSSTGVRCDMGQPEFVRNDIHSGDTGTTHAVLYEVCDGSLANNVIRSERSTAATSYALQLHDSSPDILSNSVATDPESGYSSYHAYITGTSTPRIDNNNFVQVSELGAVYCVYASAGAQPSSMRNNNLGCSQIYSGTLSATTLLELEMNLPTATDNIVVETAVMDAVSGDLRLRDDGSVPCALARGGLDLSRVLDQDRAGSMRSVPWSIGAYELDSDCE